ncbi:HAMP domain-containing protein, partial [Hydrogenophaga flava]|uniref:HAMP domain-containing protein n=1 Tax=Hydrogenophaga flava TaxID=65657 RepID=UPI000AC0B42A
MKLGQKLLLAPVVTAVVVLATGQIDSWLLGRSGNAAVASFEEHIGEVRSLGGLQSDVNLAHVEVYRMMTIIGSLDEATIQARRKDLAARSTSTLAQLDRHIAAEPEGTPQRQGMDEARRQLADYFKKTDAAIDLASVDPNTGVAAMQGADEAYSALTKALTSTQASLVEHATGDAHAKAEEADRMHWLLSLVSLVAAAAVVALFWGVLRKVARSLEQASRIARAVAGGDLTQTVDTSRKDELGDLLKALASMKDSLLNTVVQVRTASDSIGTASAEIASGNQDLSARTEQAASNLQQTAASMEQLTSTVKNSADAARQANQLAASASEIAVRGGQVVDQVVHTMQEI